MDERVSLQETNRRWEVLLSRKRQSDELVRPSLAVYEKDDDNDDDPFDCSDCAVPTTHALVEETVAQAVEEWQDLDDRKIPHDNAEPVEKKPKWFEKHVRLPEHFDYATRNAEPPPDSGGGDRVMQLDDPTVTTSYHQELWRLFESVPTRSVLEQGILQGLDSPAMMEMRQEWQDMQEQGKFRDQLGTIRLRTSDRHGAPETTFLPPTPRTQGTLIFELWKGMIPRLKRNSSPDDDRMVLEFRGEQTLADFHRVIVELTDDRFWDDAVRENNSNDKDTFSADGQVQRSSTERSGIFAIEDTLYTIGQVDYSRPIVEWLNQDQKRGTDILGVKSDKVATRTMSDVRLEEIPMRLGVRYMHRHSGTLDCQVFLVDRRHGYPRQPSVARSYPMIHDLWDSGGVAPDCEACGRRNATFATSSECDLTNGQKALCQTCVEMLGVPDKHKMPYYVWKTSGPAGNAKKQ